MAGKHTGLLRHDDRSLKRGGLDKDHILQRIGRRFIRISFLCNRSAGFISFIGLINRIELIKIAGDTNFGVVLADLYIGKLCNTVIDHYSCLIQLCVALSVNIAVEVDFAAIGYSTLGRVVNNIGGQRDGLLLKLSKVVTSEFIRCAIDPHILALGLRVGDRQRGGGGLPHGRVGRLRIQAGVILVVHQHIIFIELTGLDEQAAVVRAEGDDLRAELIAGLVAGDQIGGLVAGFAVRLPVVLADFGVLPDDLIVLAEHRLLAVQRLDAGDAGGLDLQRVGVARDHVAGDRRAGRAVALVDVQDIAVVCDIAGALGDLPAQRLGEHADVHDIGLLAVGIALVGLGFEDGPVMLSHAAGLVIADLHDELRSLAVDRGRADARTVSALLVALVEHDGALGVDVQRRLKRDLLALVLDDAVVLLRIVGHIRDLQRQRGILRKPNSVQGGVCGERSSGTGIDNNAVSFGVDGLRVPIYGDGRFAVCAPAHEFIARALRLLRGDLIVSGFAERREIILHDLRGRQTGHVVARVGVVRDRDRLALDAGDGDAGVGHHAAEVVVKGGHAGLLVRRGGLIAEGETVGRDGELAVVIALRNDQIERHIVAVGDGEGLVSRVRIGHCLRAVLPVLGFPAGAAQRVRHGDDRENGCDLGIDGQRAGDGLGKVVVRMGRRRCMVCTTPADELVALDVRLLGLCRRVAELDGLRHEGLGIPHIICQFLTVRVHNAIDKLDIRTRVFGDLDRHDLIGRHVRNRIGIGRGGVRAIGPFTRIRSGQITICFVADADRRHSRRIRAVHGHGEGEVTAVLHDEGLIAADGVAAAALKGDGVGLLRPDSVERHVIRELFGHGRARGVDHKTLIFALGPAEEVIAIAGRDLCTQRDRLAVGLLRIGKSTRIDRQRIAIGILRCVQIIVNLMRHGLQLRIDRNIAIDSSGAVKRIAGAVLLGVPAHEGVALDHGIFHGAGLAVLHVLHQIGLVEDNIRDLVELDRLHVDGHTLIHGDIFNCICAIFFLQLLAVGVHALDGVAGARRNLECNVTAIIDSHALGVRHRICEAHVNLVAYRQGDVVGQLFRRGDENCRVHRRIKRICECRYAILGGRLIDCTKPNAICSNVHTARVIARSNQYRKCYACTGLDA